MIESVDYIQKDGTAVTMTKLEAIKAEMEDFLMDIYQQKRQNDERKKPLKIEWNTRIYNKLESILLKFERPVSNSEALSIMTGDVLYACYDQYCDLCCWIECVVGISYYKNKPEFCSYAGITTTAFANFITEGDPKQREAIDDIDTRIANSVQMAAENCEIKSTSAEFRMTAKSGIGHRTQTTTAHEPIVAIPVTPNSFKKVDDYLSEIAVIPEQVGKGKRK